MEVFEDWFHEVLRDFDLVDLLEMADVEEAEVLDILYQRGLLGGLPTSLLPPEEERNEEEEFE